MDPAPSTHSQPIATSSRGQRNRRRGHGFRGNTQSRGQTQTNIPSARTFGGQLTRLSGEAPPFVPASVPPTPQSTSSAQHSKATRQAQTSRPRPAPRKTSLSRSTAPDIATRTHEDISKGIYECAICTNEVSRNSKIWSCHDCWTVFHIGCIKKWSKNEGSAVHQRQGEGEPNVGKQWRCPGCNLPKDATPSTYTCWCEKEIDPKIIMGLPPHSCGQTCGRERKFPKPCPHPCPLLCHSGPCPPCTATGPTQTCFCGREEITRTCLETDYDAGWSCGAICDDTMPCGEHSCPRPCHPGICGACTVEVDAKCYCGKVEKKMACSDKDEELDSYEWVGVFNCKQICDRWYDCGAHRCEKTCHPQEEQTSHCPRSPDIVNRCPCGKTALGDLGGEERKSCSDPIQSCQKPCGKQLSCSHTCSQICHTGECMACTRIVQITCRCGRNSFDTVCHQSNIDPPQCMKVCKATLNCGRHECGEKCCTGDRKAIERQATKRKMKTLNVGAFEENIEAEHICTRVCGRLLKCGNHTCPDLCHKGPCTSCKEAIFDDLTCNCGRTVLQAPLPCGTRPPPCNFPCRRSTACGHPAVAHNCHPDDEVCPKCPFLTEKKCLCGKQTLKNQPCWRADVLCGLVCGKTLKCGSHACRLTCHKPGECEDAHQRCTQECGKAKKTCGHPDENACHAPSSCKEDKPCPFKIIITCSCQRIKEEVRCNARVGTPNPPGRQTSLKCDDECRRLERNRNLAEALHISDDHTDDHVPYSNQTLTLYLEDVAWSHKQEDILRLFAADDNEKRYRFPPMKGRQRWFLHSIAEDFGFDSESLDPEPHRHVLLFKTPKFVAAPMKTLAQAARIRRGQLKVTAPSDSTPTRTQEKRDWNGLLLTKPRFALTEDEVRECLGTAAPATEFEITFLTNDDGVAILPQVEQPEALLTSLLPAISAEVVKSEIAVSAVIAAFDTLSFQTQLIATQPTSMATAAGGWAQVAGKKTAPMPAPVTQPVGQKPVYTVLGSRLKEAKEKKKENEEILKRIAKENAEAVDDWEAEAEKDQVDSGSGMKTA